MSDKNEPRLEKLSRALIAAAAPHTLSFQGPFIPSPSERVYQLFLPKDATLETRKCRLRRIVTDFEKEKKYTGHITIDVDPI